MSMTYHDNEIKFTCGVPGKILSGGRYTISSFCVTKGQDPDGHIANGRVYTMPTRGSNRFIFNVGRKKIRPVANWFNTNIPPLHNTFGKEADELTFAFLGRLELVISRVRYTFEGVSFAQGSNLQRNVRSKNEINAKDFQQAKKSIANMGRNREWKNGRCPAV